MSCCGYEFPKIDMETFYREALKCNKFAGMPQILIVKDLGANRNALRYAFPNGSSVLCLKYGKNTLKTLRNEMKKATAVVEAAPAELLHALNEEQVGYLVTYGILTCNMLKISCPQFVFADTLGAESESCVECNVVSLKTTGDSDPILLLKAMFKELRCLWQAKQQLAAELAEVDAVAFAAKLYGAITEQEPAIAGDADFQAKVKAQAESIELNEDTVELFKSMLKA